MGNELAMQKSIPSLKLPSPPKIGGWEITLFLGRPIFRCYVSFREGRSRNNIGSSPYIHTRFDAASDHCISEPYGRGSSNAAPSRVASTGPFHSSKTGS